MWVVERTLHQGERMTVAGSAWLGIAAGLLVNAKLVNVLVLVPVAVYLVWQRIRRDELRDLGRAAPLALIAFFELAAIALFHNHLKTGSYFDTGYRIPVGIFSGDLLSGLYGFLFSTGKSAFLYSPPLLLAVLGARTAWRERRGETVFLLSVIAVVLVYNAKFRHWHADYCWGPRHLVPLTPLAMLLALPWVTTWARGGARRLRRVALAALFVIGFGVQVLGSSLYWDHYIRALIAVKDQTGAPGWFTEHLSHGHYVPPFSPLLGQVWLLRHLAHGDPDLQRDAPWHALVPTKFDSGDVWPRLRLDWWLLEWIEPLTTPPLPKGPQLELAKHDARLGWVLFAIGAFATALAAAGVLARLRAEMGASEAT
jgi:hypothetical protein